MAKHSDIDHTGLTGTGMANPMTTAGDAIYGGASGAPTRLPIGTAGQVLTVNAGATAPEWAAAGGGGGSSIPTMAVGSWHALGFVSAVSVSGALAADRIYVARYVPTEDVTVANASWQCSTSSGNLDFGIYNEALTTKLGSTGSFASPGTGVRSQALTAPVAMTAGNVYYLAFVSSSATLRIPTVLPPAAMGYGAWNLYGLQSSVALPLPASVTPTWDAGGATYPIFWFTE